MEFKHVSVLLQETVDGLNVKPDGIYVDGTLGVEDTAMKCAPDWVRRGVL